MRNQYQKQQQTLQFGMQQYVPPTEQQSNKRSRSREKNSALNGNKTLYQAPIRKTLAHKSSQNLQQTMNFSSLKQSLKSENLFEGKNTLLEQYLLQPKTTTNKPIHNSASTSNLQKSNNEFFTSIQGKNGLDKGQSKISNKYGKRKLQYSKDDSKRLTLLERDFMNPQFPNEEDVIQEDLNYDRVSQNKLSEQENKNPRELVRKNPMKRYNSEMRLPRIKAESKNKKHQDENQHHDGNVKKRLNPQRDFGQVLQNNAFSQKNNSDGNIKEDSDILNIVNSQFSDIQINNDQKDNENQLLNKPPARGYQSKKKLSYANQGGSELNKFKQKFHKKTVDDQYFMSSAQSPYQAPTGSLTSMNQQKTGYKGLYTSQNKRNVAQVPQKRSYTPGQLQKKLEMKKQSEQSELQINTSHMSHHSDHQKQKSNYICQVSQHSRAGANLQGTKTNQDSFIIKRNLCHKHDRSIFSVCDGHGQYGHLVSQFLKQHLPKIIEENLMKEPECVDDSFVENTLNLSFLQMSQMLLESDIDCTFSGSTCSLVLMMGETIWTANVGDSRATMASGKGYSNYKAKPLTRDHKVDDPEELERILAKGGRAEPYRDLDGNQVGPYRVWLKDEELPGLAMARSFGDIIATQAGVICEPEVLKHELTEDDRFMVVCSDGVWEFIEDQQAVNMALPYYIKSQPEQACLKLVKESVQLWKQNDEVIDDITAVMVHFKRPQRLLKPEKPTVQQKIKQQNNFFGNQNQANNNNNSKVENSLNISKISEGKQSEQN